MMGVDLRHRVQLEPGALDAGVDIRNHPQIKQADWCCEVDIKPGSPLEYLSCADQHKYVGHLLSDKKRTQN